MSIRTACYAACDACGDPAEVTTRGHKEARTIARADGWVRVSVDGKMRDICPRHTDGSDDEVSAAVRAWTGYKPATSEPV